MTIAASELVLNNDGSVYHLRLLPEHIAETVLLVGDPARVTAISDMFDRIEYKISNREFVTHTGYYRGKRITALATGIGTDNIDIVVNELDAAVNINLHSRALLPEMKSLKLIRIGTCGALHADMAPDSVIVTEYAIGLDGVAHHYAIDEQDDERRLREAYQSFTSLDDEPRTNIPYVAQADPKLLQGFQHLGKRGLTLTANGFFGPQGRALRLPIARPDFNDHITGFAYNGLRIENYEMESAALYALGHALGHRCICVCMVVANRKSKAFSTRYHEAMNKLIREVLDSLSGH